MNRRTLLATVGLGCLTGCTDTQIPPNSPGPQDDPADGDQSATSDNADPELHTEFTVGTRNGLVFPDANQPARYRILNREESQQIQIIIRLNGDVAVNKSFTLPNGKCVSVTLQQPANYDIRLGLERDHDLTPVAQLSGDEFSCTPISGTITINSAGHIKSRVITPDIECPTPQVTDTTFQSQDGECGQRHAATVSVSDKTVSIAGQVAVPQPCYEAMLESASYDTATETLTVTVAVGSRTRNICVNCIGEVPYEADIELQHGYPQNILVQHRESNGEVVTVTRGSA